jgi:hypothetical protein
MSNCIPKKLVKSAITLFCVLPGLLLGSNKALADGTDILEPTTAVLAEGTRFIGAGVGLALGQPEEIEIDIPAGASVKQVLIYWDGFDREYLDAAPVIGVTTDTIEVAGNPVEGVFIGGRARAADVQHFTFRADITGLGLISDGPNSIAVNGLDFGDDGVENGAGLLVIVDQGTTSSLQLFDGSDYADINCPDDFNCQETVKRTFTFPAADTARDAELLMFFAGVTGAASGGGFRPSVIRIWVGAAPPIELINEINNGDGEEWDTIHVEFAVPAGETVVEVQAFSEDVDFEERRPASFNWIAAGLSVPEDSREGLEGCTPGYWKQAHHYKDWTSPYEPTDLFSDYFEDAFPGQNLVQVLDNGGGGLDALGRHTVAALLNAANPDVDYPLAVQEVINGFNAVYPGSKDDYEMLKDQYVGFNELGCPLNNGNHPENGNGPREDDAEDVDQSSASLGNSTNSASLDKQTRGGGAAGLWEILALMIFGTLPLWRDNLRVCRRLTITGRKNT